MAAEYVRVKLQNGSHKSVRKDHAERLGLTVLKQDAVGRDGRLLPPKHRVDLGTASAAKSSSTRSAKSTTEAPASTDASKE